jgi:photosystem II stability/assembly factor-like uncharacterized protein
LTFSNVVGKRRTEMLKQTGNDAALIKAVNYLSKTKHDAKYHEEKIIHCRLFPLLILLTLLVETFFVCPCIASTQEQYGFKIGRRDKAFGIHFGDHGNGWIVGDNGLALKSEDGGESWQRVSISEDDSFNDVYFVGAKGWIVGGGGVILHTDDGGKSWVRQSAAGGEAPTIKANIATDRTCPAVEPSSSLRQALMRVHFVDQNIGVTVGADGTILRTEDGGESWQNVSPDWMGLMPAELMDRGVLSINLYDVIFLNETSGWVVGDWGTILHTLDGGKTWSLSHIGQFPPLFSVCFKNDKVGWAVGQNGFALKSENGGASWDRFSVNTENSLYRIQLKDDYGVMAGDQATMFKTDDGGLTWASVDVGLRPPYPYFSDVCLLLSNSAKVVSVGNGIILKSTISTK